MEIDYLRVEEKIRAGYRLATARYRLDDEIEVRTEHHRKLARTLKEICLSFPHSIQVLDVGCGTGRYFHCLGNVNRLVGLDVSEDMLAAAKSPVLGDSIAALQIELIRGNAYLTTFPPASFDFIYCLGMFGYGCPVTPDICDRFHHWLKAGGKLFFNMVDSAGLPLCHRFRQRLRLLLYPVLSRALQERLDARRQSPFFSLTKKQLLGILRATRFAHFQVTARPCESPLWNGRHLECLATKEQEPRSDSSAQETCLSA